MIDTEKRKGVHTFAVIDTSSRLVWWKRMTYFRVQVWKKGRGCGMQVGV